MIDDLDASQMMAKKLNDTSLLKNSGEAPAGSGMAVSGSGMASSSSASGKASVLGSQLNLQKMFGPGWNTGTRTMEELNADFAVQINSLRLAGSKIYKLNLHLSEAKEAKPPGFPAKNLAFVRKTFNDKINEITAIESNLLKFVGLLSPVENARLLDKSSHFGKYTTDWMEAFKPLFADLETLIKELKGKGKAAVNCTIDTLRYPAWDPAGNTFMPGCIPFECPWFCLDFGSSHAFQYMFHCDNLSGYTCDCAFQSQQRLTRTTKRATTKRATRTTTSPLTKVQDSL